MSHNETHIDRDRRRELVDTAVTLDGEPARITGSQLAFPVVRSRTACAEFNWDTADRIVRAGGHFHS